MAGTYWSSWLLGSPLRLHWKQLAARRCGRDRRLGNPAGQSCSPSLTWRTCQSQAPSPYGSWTLEDRQTEQGVEPDECYVFGAVSEPERPDLAIEVVWTSGGVQKLDIYAALGVPEVWFWRRGRITIHLLEGHAYVEARASGALPGIDLVQLASYLDRPTASQALREYRAALAQEP